MNEAAKNKNANKTQPPELARWKMSVWALFLCITVASLVIDLGLKAWSFEHVANTPIQVRTHEAGGPEVLVPELGSDAFLPAHEATPTRDPLTRDRRVVPFHEPTKVVPGLLNFQLTLNTGAVFGTGQGGRPIFILVSVFAAGVIVFLIYRSPVKARFYQVGLALILGGALGNLYDRVCYSAVRDMLHMLPGVELPFGLAYPGGVTEVWPWIFNPADVALIVGVGMVLVMSWWTDRKASKNAAK